MADADPDAATTSRKRAWDTNDALRAAEGRERKTRERLEVQLFNAQTEHFNATIERAGSHAYILELLQEGFDYVSGVLLQKWPKTDAKTDIEQNYENHPKSGFLMCKNMSTYYKNNVY